MNQIVLFFRSDFPYRYLPVKNTHSPKTVEISITRYPVFVISPSSVRKSLFFPKNFIMIQPPNSVFSHLSLFLLLRRKRAAAQLHDRSHAAGIRSRGQSVSRQRPRYPDRSPTLPYSLPVGCLHRKSIARRDCLPGFSYACFAALISLI